MERGLLQEPLCDLLDLCVPLLGGRHGGKTEVRAVLTAPLEIIADYFANIAHYIYDTYSVALFRS